jgi:hypothetical protein
MSEESAKKKIQVSLEEGGVADVTINGTKVAEVSPDGNVVVFTNEDVQTKPAAAATEDKQLSIGKDFNTVAIYGAKVKLATDGSVIVYTNGIVTIEPAAANDIFKIALEAGARMVDGSVFAGIAPGGKQIVAMPTDLAVTLTFDDATQLVEKLNSENAFGHDDWVIPTQEQLKILQRNQDKGDLAGTFCTAARSGSAYPGWYWSSSEGCGNPSVVWDIHFSDGGGAWVRKDINRLSCRPVRLV